MLPQICLLGNHDMIYKNGAFYPLVICYIAIENGHRNSGFSQLENGGSFHSFL